MNAPFPTLPEEVMERLATHPQVRVAVGSPGDTATLGAWAAPLHDELYLLFPSTPDLEARLSRTVRAELRASDPDGDWTVTARGRLHLGRSARACERRSELFHWLPAGQDPARLQATLFFPEVVDYQRNTATGRQRAQGPVRGSEVPEGPSAWTHLMSWRVLPWMLAFPFIEWLALLAIDEKWRNGVVLALMVAIGYAFLGSVTLVGIKWRYDAWRKGRQPRDAALALMRVGLPPGPLVRVATLLAGGAFVFTLLFGAMTTWLLAVFTVLVCGAPFVAPFLYARYAAPGEVE